jgi:hypothetical protein
MAKIITNCALFLENIVGTKSTAGSEMSLPWRNVGKSERIKYPLVALGKLAEGTATTNEETDGIYE